MRVAVAQIKPALLDQAKTLERVLAAVSTAADSGCQLVAFGEALVPGYPFWSEHGDGARFNSARQQALFARYADQAVVIERGDLDAVSQLAAQRRIAVVLGTIERAPDRAAHTLYCSCVSIDDAGKIQAVHRKLMPTYDERLNWGAGDGHGLRTWPLGDFTVGALNCWENWLPLPRAALHAQGENLHVAIWPGSKRNTVDITRFLALEGRSFVLSASGLMHADDLPEDLPELDQWRPNGWLADGGSAIAGPDGEWLVEPQVGAEGVHSAEVDLDRVYRARQNLDISGHYSRPDVLQLQLDRTRQGVLQIKD